MENISVQGGYLSGVPIGHFIVLLTASKPRGRCQNPSQNYQSPTLEVSGSSLTAGLRLQNLDWKDG